MPQPNHEKNSQNHQKSEVHPPHSQTSASVESVSFPFAAHPLRRKLLSGMIIRRGIRYKSLEAFAGPPVLCIILSALSPARLFLFARELR